MCGSLTGTLRILEHEKEAEKRTRALKCVKERDGRHAEEKKELERTSVLCRENVPFMPRNLSVKLVSYDRRNIDKQYFFADKKCCHQYKVFVSQEKHLIDSDGRPTKGCKVCYKLLADTPKVLVKYAENVIACTMGKYDPTYRHYRDVSTYIDDIDFDEDVRPEKRTAYSFYNCKEEDFAMAERRFYAWLYSR